MRARILGLLFVIVGIGLGATTWTVERNERRLREGTIAATGTVVTVLPRGPVVSFPTRAGDRVSFTATRGGKRFARGASVPIYYHPDNPTFADLNDPRSRWQNTILSSVFAVIALAVGAALTRASGARG